MNRKSNSMNFSALLHRRPHAYAPITGHSDYPALHGTVRFYQTPVGVLVSAEIEGLPQSEGECHDPVFGFHIHEGGSCTGNTDDPFADVMLHYNPHSCAHPYHAGDMLPLFGADGRAYLVFLTDRFSVEEITGRTVIIHASPDDYTTQPGGNAGKKIACGIIR